MPSLTTSRTADELSVSVADRFPALCSSLELLSDGDPVVQINNILQQDDDKRLIDFYHQAIHRLEDHIWQQTGSARLYKLQQQLYRELETLFSGLQTDDRHEITIVIPVADRPRQLSDIINSLITQCEHFGYGGYYKGYYRKVAIIIADDSSSDECIENNRQLASLANEQGLHCHYFGRDEQSRLINSIPASQRHQLSSQIGHAELARDGHRGPSVMRNLSYLYLNKHLTDKDRRILYFVDSDQLFSVSSDPDDAYPVNYLYYLDRVFSTDKVLLATGKVVGDPPVSPAVMANTFIDDVMLFLNRILRLEAEQECQFHRHSAASSDSAAYHDMAELFGFTAENKPHDYQCHIQGHHTNRLCFAGFCRRLNHFFYGEHPTRSTHYHYLNPVDSLQTARTVYTGNYAFKTKALEYFIPFSNLRLRMAGPTLGRILQSVIGPQFVSVNLPMLHKRTIGECGTAEYRVGVDQQDNHVDLTTEFIRQYYGDVMLFSIEQLCHDGYPVTTPNQATISSTVRHIASTLNDKYHEKQASIMDKLASLRELISRIRNDETYRQALPELEVFAANIERNYGPGSDSFHKIDDPAENHMQLEQIISAIADYQDDLGTWQAVLATQS
jgi:hypothetical protein